MLGGHFPSSSCSVYHCFTANSFKSRLVFMSGLSLSGLCLTSRNNTFSAPNSCYRYCQRFGDGASMDLVRQNLLELSETEWEAVKLKENFLEALHELIVDASGSGYSTISLQPAVYSCFKIKCMARICSWASRNEMKNYLRQARHFFIPSFLRGDRN